MPDARPMRPDWLHALRDLVGADLRRYGDGASARAFARHYLLTPGFRYTFWMRLAGALRERGRLWRPLHYACRLVLARCGVRYGISIPYNARVGAGLYIGHHGGIVVHPGAQLGSGCNLNHGVTIGMKYGGRNPGVPVVGDRVYLGPGCKVIGGVRLGDDSAVGANAVVVDAVPAGRTVAGIPARVVSEHGSSEYVINLEQEKPPCRSATACASEPTS